MNKFGLPETIPATCPNCGASSHHEEKYITFSGVICNYCNQTIAYLPITKRNLKTLGDFIGGDKIVVNIGNNASKIAIGTNIVQNIKGIF